MKALIISDDQNVISSLDLFMKDKGFDTIIYRWLLKALDNVEEIRPDCIIVSSSEYPRHWKTLVQFVKSGIGGNNIAIFLYEPNPLSQEDSQKAELLGISGTFSGFDFNQLTTLSKSIDDFYGLNQINLDENNLNTDELTASDEIVANDKLETEIINENVSSQNDVNHQDVSVPFTESINTNEENLEDNSEAIITVDSLVDSSFENEIPTVDTVEAAGLSVNGTGDYIFTHPVTKKLISGKYFDYNGSKITLQIFDEGILDKLEKEQKVEYLSFFNENTCKSCDASVNEVITFNDNNLLVLDIGKFYEKI